MDCSCVSRHSPSIHVAHLHHVWPQGMGGPDEAWNLERVCPEHPRGGHQLIRLWGYRYDGRPPLWIVRSFPEKARALAELGWSRWHEAGRPVPKER